MSYLARQFAAIVLLASCFSALAETHQETLINGRLLLAAESFSAKAAPIAASYRVNGSTASVDYLIKLTPDENLDFTLSLTAYGSNPTALFTNSFNVGYAIVADFDPSRIVYWRPQATIDARSTWANASSPDGNVFRDTFGQGAHNAKFSFNLTDIKAGYGRFPDGAIDGALLVTVGVSLVPEAATLPMFMAGLVLAAFMGSHTHSRRSTAIRNSGSPFFNRS